jgi:hypothetical protein
VLRRSRRQQQRYSKAALLDEMDCELLAHADRLLSAELRDFRHEGQVGDQFATAAAVAGRRNACEAGVRPPQIRFGGIEQGRGAMQMALALSAPFDVDALKYLALQRCAQALHGLKAVLPRGLLQSFLDFNDDEAISLVFPLALERRSDGFAALRIE